VWPQITLEFWASSDPGPLHDRLPSRGLPVGLLGSAVSFRALFPNDNYLNGSSGVIICSANKPSCWLMGEAPRCVDARNHP
jgi:hypothetical protein